MSWERPVGLVAQLQTKSTVMSQQEYLMADNITDSA
jgi:hypothetical protein